ncbi:two-component sensor histidine kinase [Diaminobutyricibacter tongyongensis]|uniref:histidine kinase n=1 Tax=Leifsonia tongyongensis TaxID=1268043 RepID=A0A6L9XSW6_9MICO|nr:histidine kinase [Diaminobutyricibacter tongyongensis]NEN04511.1 two-component sensor histidine kinase [Diaminobutyricibacter tongyongensis]
MRRPTWLSFGLNLFGIAVVGYSIVTSHSAQRPTWVLVLALTALAAWLVRLILAFRTVPAAVGLALAMVMAFAGSIVAGSTNGVGIVPVIVGVMLVVSDPSWPIRLGLAVAVISVLLVVLGAVPFDTAVVAELGLVAGIAIAVLAGISRRQFRESEAQAALLRERELAVREERAQVELLAQRQSVARDIHDVLAHSLGGLVIQLDAVEALLETGDVGGARSRVADARALAADGLGEARRAVDALRDPDAQRADHPGDGSFDDAISDLLAAHRSLGGAAELITSGTPGKLDADLAGALERALQEALSNARKHAPGEPVQAVLAWSDHGVRLTVSNPLGAHPDSDGSRGFLARSGGSHGLEGMRERFAALPAGGRATAGVDDGRFIVTAEARLA